jgi:hypothetical protein
MTVFELVVIPSWIDWASRGTAERIGVYSSPAKAEAKIAEIKLSEHWRMDWADFEIKEITVE